MAEHVYGYRPTTTHAGWGEGHPHLLVSREDERFVHHLTTDVVTIGSSEGCDLSLDGATAVHARIEHDPRDEYVLTMHGPGEMNASSPRGASGERTEILRTGARFTIAGWTLVFSRDEFADHGRPYGGREGGEGTHQNPQPDRPDYPVTGAVRTPPS